MKLSSRPLLLSAMIAALCALVLLFNVSSNPAHGAPPQQSGIETPAPTPRRVPPNQPQRGMIYDGLEYGNESVCKGGFKLRDSNHCTHGPDPAPLGVDVRTSAAPIALNAPASVSAIQCDGNGTAGYRTQVMYVRGSDKPDRYSTYLASFKAWAADADQIYRDSASETGGYRRLRFAHDANCNIIVASAVLTWTGSIDFNKMSTALALQGFNHSDRKYMIFMDDTSYCGIGDLWPYDMSSQSNPNNLGPSYARADYDCWTGPVIAHESMHNMGAVQLSAPHTSGGYHCVDEWDRMCYSDQDPVHGIPPMQIICPSSSHDRLFDCNHDDYYHTNPTPGSYLANHWNTANNRFLITAPAALFYNYLPILLK
jgi:hypothetical protein